MTRDLAINYKYLDDSEVSVGILFLMAVGFVLPSITILFVGCIFPLRCGAVQDQTLEVVHACEGQDDLEALNGSEESTTKIDTKIDTLYALTAFYFGVGTTEFTTSFIKYWVGRLRPNFYDMCEWSDELLQCTSDNDRLLAESRKSFPSGHSSLSFCGCVFMALFLTLKLTINNVNKRDNLSPFTKDMLGLAIFFLPLWLAGYVAASRVHDNWHHVGDVIAGGLIGSLSSAFTFSRLYLTKRK